MTANTASSTSAVRSAIRSTDSGHGDDRGMDIPAASLVRRQPDDAHRATDRLWHDLRRQRRMPATVLRAAGRGPRQGPRETSRELVIRQAEDQPAAFAITMQYSIPIENMVLKRLNSMAW